MTSDSTLLLYPYGFLLGTQLERVPQHYSRTAFPISLWVHPATKHAIRTDADGTCFLTGDLVHPDFPEHGIDQIAATLMSLSETKRQSEIDKLIGRFAFLLHTTEGVIVQTDATGMRSVYFTDSAPTTIVGSHAHLVAQAAGDISISASASKRKWGCAGLTTIYEGVLRLPPNVVLNLDTGDLRRFHPLEPLKPQSVEAAWRFALRRARQAANAFAGREKLSVSLTAGKDSRTTLMALRDIWTSVDFFTYSGGVDSHEIDRAIATRIADRLGLQHRVLNYSDFEMSEDLQNALRKNGFCSHQHKLAAAYSNDTGLCETVHIRSNLLELARSNLYGGYGKSDKYPDGLSTASAQADFYARMGKLECNPWQAAAFAKSDWMSELELALLHVSSWDLFFVEHRMGAWRAGILEESDIAFPTTNLFNSREIVTGFWASPESDRFSSTILMGLFEELLPELSGIPINPKGAAARAILDAK